MTADKIIEGAKEVLRIANEGAPAARLFVDGHFYVPETEIARIRAEALEEAIAVVRRRKSKADFWDPVSEERVCEDIEDEIRALIPSPPLVDQGGQQRVEDRLDEPEHRTPVHDTVWGVDEHPSAVDTDKARGGVLDVDFGHGWSPIETIPKGEHVLLYFPYGEKGRGGVEAGTVFPEDDGSIHCIWTHGGPNSGSDWEPVEAPTHWMPLPEPPAKESA
jgi:hypothetical protein